MTSPSTISSNQNFRQVIRGYLRLHQLTVEGRDESVEADAIRDSLDLPWRVLNETEKNRVQGLSIDLFAISDPSENVPMAMNPQAQKNLTEAFEAKQQGDWDRALALLRRWNKYITPELVSYLQAGIWLGAGCPELAAVFYEHAAELAPENANYRALFLSTLEQSDQHRAQEIANQILQHPNKNSPVLVIRAALVAFNATTKMVEPDASNEIRSLITVLTKTIPNLSQTENLSSYLMGLILLAQCHELLGEMNKALEFYSHGLRMDPSHDVLLTGRGILTYGKSSQSTLDLEQAVRLGSPLVWPFFFLAHHYITNNRYEDCRQICERGLRLNASHAVQSQLYEWLAIAEAGLGFPPVRVRSMFEQALRLDAENDMARANLETFEQSIHSPKTPTPWEKRSENSVRAFGQAERRLLAA